MSVKILFGVLALSLVTSGPAYTRPTAQRSVSEAQVTGTWRLKNRSQDNEFKILALGGGKLKVAFEGLYKFRTFDGERMAHSGIAEGTATISGDTAVFKPDETEDCTITLRFARGKMFVGQEGLCGFGFNVTAEGAYRKSSKAKPTFD